MPFTLTREVRIALAAEPLSSGELARGRNPWSHQPASIEPVPTVRVRLTVAGDVEPSGGYLCDIRVLDRMVRETVTAWYRESVPKLTWLGWLDEFSRRLVSRSDELPHGCSIWALEIETEPQLTFRQTRMEPSVVEITRQFEFSASHRLHSMSLSDEANRELFGKCNRLHGHGHNYVLAVTVSRPATMKDDNNILAELDRHVREAVIDRLDHWNLNTDVPEFKQLNPTVENIAWVIQGWLQATLPAWQWRRIRLYETPKTWVDLEIGDNPT